MVTHMFDSWADDAVEVDPGSLPRRLEQLADNEPPPLPNEGAARRRRIDRMERELNDCAEFVNDCDRYSEAVRDVHLVGGDLRPMMDAHLARLRRRAVERGRELHAELKVIRPSGRAAQAVAATDSAGVTAPGRTEPAAT